MREILHIFLKTQRKMLFTIFTIIVSCLLLVAGLYLVREYQLKKMYDSEENREIGLPDPKREGKVQSIAIRFACVACGICEMPLETCNCKSAIEIRNYILTELLANQDEKAITVRVNERFGGLEEDIPR